MSLQAWIRPWTDSTDFLNIAFSSSLVVNSMTFSTPPAPSRAGTPTYRPDRPYSPVQPDGARQDALLVQQIGFGHGDGAFGGA